MNEKFLLNKKSNISKNKIDEMTLDIQNILDSSLMKTTTAFDKKKCIELICEYIQKHDRLLYSVISNYIFSLNNQQQGIFITNLDDLTKFVLSDEFNTKYNNKYIYVNTKNTIIKLWDHSHLALNQFQCLKQDDEEFTRSFIKNMEPVRKDMDKQVDEFGKSMNSQLISLVGIFTAMSFLVFGGINSLDNIFQGAKSVPILQIMIIGSIWGLCITNLVFVFMFFISKMTRLNIKSCQDEKATLVQKYPLVFWSDLIIITVLALCSWLYYIDIKNMGGWFISIGEKNPCVISILGLVIIGLIFSIFSYILIDKYNKQFVRSAKKS